MENKKRLIEDLKKYKAGKVSYTYLKSEWLGRMSLSLFDDLTTGDFNCREVADSIERGF